MPSDQPIFKRFKYILGWLSKSLSIPLDHINVDSLVNGDPLSLYNLLEILDICTGANEDSDVNSLNLNGSEGSVVLCLKWFNISWLHITWFSAYTANMHD